MKNKKPIFFLQSVFILVLLLMSQVVFAEEVNVNFSLVNNGATVFSSTLPLSAEGVVSISDSEGNTQEVNVRSVLNIVKNADDISSEFNISNLIYYPSFTAFYLKCITVNTDGELCDGWMYKVNGEGPDSGMDQNILSGGADVVLYFGSDEETVTEEPLVEEEPEPEPKRHSSSGSVARYSPAISDLEKEVEPTIEVEQDLPKSIVEEKKEVKPFVAQVVSKKEIKKIEPEIKIENTASAINAADQIPDPASETQKKNWFEKFLGWLFGY